MNEDNTRGNTEWIIYSMWKQRITVMNEKRKNTENKRKGRKKLEERKKGGRRNGKRTIRKRRE